MTVPMNHVERLEEFSGLNFKRWQQKMILYLITLKLARFLTGDPPKANEDHRYYLMAFNVWKISDYLCQNYVLNSLTDMLYTRNKKSYLSVDISSKYRLSTGTDKIFPIESRLAKNSAKNKKNSRYFDEISEIFDILAKY